MQKRAMFHKKTPIRDRKVRFALVGCGRISSKHTEALAKHSETAEIVAVCDSSREALDRVSSSTGAQTFHNLDQLLAESNADAVILATPSGLHASQAIKVARAERHVITEKPMATRWKDAKRMVAECDSHGVRLFVVKQNRFNSTLQALKKAVEMRRFGRIYMVNINVFWNRSQDYYDSSKWRGTWEFDGGALMNQASHYVDLVDWIVGPVESVQAQIGTLARAIEVEDSAVVGLKWRSGALGSINVTMLAYKQNFEGSITILGEKGTVRIGGVAVNDIQHWEFSESHPDDEKIKSANYQTDSVYGFGHSAYYQNVIQSLRGEAEPMTDGREGLRSLELLIASYVSARDGKRVALPLEY
jgi:UDP-N-acetyl-2-amino-2-deoxyglucuronate dehydrogenase